MDLINNPLFAKAFKEWEACRLRIKVEIQKMSTMSCPPCGPNPVMGSADGPLKLRRRASAGVVRKPKNDKKRYSFLTNIPLFEYFLNSSTAF